MEITQEQADKFCSSLRSFHDSLADDEKQVLEQVLDQAAPPEDMPADAKQGRPFPRGSWY